MKKIGIAAIAFAAYASLISPVGQFPKELDEVKQGIVCVLKHTIEEDDSAYLMAYQTINDMSEHTNVFPSEDYLEMLHAMDKSFGKVIDNIIINKSGADLKSVFSKIDSYYGTRFTMDDKLREFADYRKLYDSFVSMSNENQLRKQIASSLLIEVPDKPGNYNVLLSCIQHNIRDGLSFHGRPEAVKSLVELVYNLPDEDKGWERDYLDVATEILEKYVDRLAKVCSQDDYMRWYQDFDVFSGTVQMTFEYLKDKALSSQLKALEKRLESLQVYSPPGPKEKI